jgi:hypothetical protein
MVCVICGSVDECSHDEESSNNGDGPSAEDHGAISPLAGDQDKRGDAGRRRGEDGAYEMVTNAVILPGTEVFNTYGNSLSNAQLLARYGFMLPEGNEGNDGVRWRIADLRTFEMMMRRRAEGEPRMNDGGDEGKGLGRRRGGAYQAVELWRDLVRGGFRRPEGKEFLFEQLEQFWERSDLVVVGSGDDDKDDRHQEAGDRNRIGQSTNHLTEEHNEEDEGEDEDVDGGGANVVQLGLDGDARMTWQLWTFCVLLNLDVSEEGEDEGEDEEADAANAIVDSARPRQGGVEDGFGHERVRDQVSRVVSKLRRVAELQLSLEAKSRGLGQWRYCFFFFLFAWYLVVLTNAHFYWMKPLDYLSKRRHRGRPGPRWSATVQGPVNEPPTGKWFRAGGEGKDGSIFGQRELKTVMAVIGHVAYDSHGDRALPMENRANSEDGGRDGGSGDEGSGWIYGRELDSRHVRERTWK